MAPASSYALLYLGEASIDRTAFDERGHRAGGAFGTAFAAHAILLLSVWGLARVDQAVTPSTAAASAIGPFIFSVLAGDGTGRSAGGDLSAGLPSLAARGAPTLGRFP